MSWPPMPPKNAAQKAWYAMKESDISLDLATSLIRDRDKNSRANAIAILVSIQTKLRNAGKALTEENR